MPPERDGTEGRGADADLARRAQRLLVELLELDDADRASLLEARCGDDARLKAEVLSLLRASASAGGFLDTPAIAAARGQFAAEEPSLLDRELGGFRLVEELGRGGMGVVYRARQRSPERDVAVKVTPCAVSLSGRRRFESESRALARMQHPSIASVFEAGVDLPSGLAWIAMEFVEGGTAITAYARDASHSLESRLRLFREACDAVHHGHLKGVIHRDLKPSNILVGRDGRVKVIDFGIARLLGPDDTNATVTADGLPIGTLPYMSPEQCGNEPVDLRTDVYSMGVVLHELIAGAPPFAVQSRSLEAALRTIRTEPAPALRRIAREIPRDLETVVLTALEKDPRRRYQSVAALAEDILRVEQHRPIEARPARWTHHVALFARRHVAVVAASLCVMLVMVAATVVSLRFAFEAQRERDAAIRHSYVATIASAGAALDAGELFRLRQQLDQAPASLRGWEWRYLDRQSRSANVLFEPAGSRGARVTATAWHPTRPVIVTGDITGTVRFWQSDGTEIAEPIAFGEPVNCVAWSHDGTLLAIGANRQPIRVLRCGTDGAPGAPLPQRFELIASGVVSVDISRDGSTLLYSGERGARLWRIADGAELATVPFHGALRGAAFDPSGERFAVCRDQEVEIRSAADGSLLRTISGSRVFIDAIAWRGDGTELAIGDDAGLILLCDPPTGELRGQLRGHTRGVRAIAYAPDGRTLLTGSDDQRLILWDRATLSERRVLPGHHDLISAVALSGDGSAAVSTSFDGTARVWDLASDDRMSREFGASWRPTMRTLAHSPDGTRLLVANEHGHAELLDAESWTPIASLDTPGTGWWQGAFSPDGSRIAIGHGPDEVLLYDATLTTLLTTIRQGREGGDSRSTSRRAAAIAFAPDGKRLATGGGDYAIRVWDISGDEPRCVTTVRGGAGGHGAEVVAILFGEDGRTLYSASVDRSVACWALNDGPSASKRWMTIAHEDVVLSLALHPKDGTLVSGGRDQRAVLYAAATGEIRGVLEGHGQAVSAMAFTGDGSRLFTASLFGDVKVWEWATRSELLTLRAQALGAIRAIALRPTGTELVAVGSGALTRWSTTRLRYLRPNAPTATSPSGRPGSGSGSADTRPDSAMGDVPTR